jgi:PAS domain S-box-containing protein
MTSEWSGPVGASECLPPVVTVSSPSTSFLVDEGANIELSPGLRSDLLDLDAWGKILPTYSRIMRLAVALADDRGNLLGECHNAQPVWRLVHAAAADWATGCPFCITKGPPCAAIEEAMRTGQVVMAHDQAGLAHVAVPLLLGKQHLGAIIAGQVFDRYPEPLSLRRVARDFGIAGQQLWEVARKQRPVSSSFLQASGELLCALGKAFLQQRYGAILEAKVAETNGRFRLLVEGAKDHALFTMDATGNVTSWNVGTERMFGFVEAEILGQNFSCIFTPEDIQNHVPEKQLHEAMEAGRARHVGWRVRENRTQFWASVNITALLEDAGRLRGFAIIVEDVTERHKIAMAFEEARQERSHLQEKLLSHVSHELRTPLTAIYLFTTNVLDGLHGDLNSEQREQLTFVLDNVSQLKSMVSDLLDVTRVETHRLTIEPQHVNLDKMIGEVLGTCRKNAAAKSISLRSKVAPDLPFLWADPARVLQILINLIDNGIKFSPEGGTVTVEGRSFAEDDGFLCVAVSDTGCGISRENREMIFDRLAQVEGSAGASRSGLGLGLFIAKDLVLRHHGQIWVESQLGQGSTFYFTLPVFSLAKLCAHIFTTANLQGGVVTLIAVDMVADQAVHRADMLPEVRKVLERCIHPGQDVLLPFTNDAGPVVTFFIVACANAGGFEVISRRISSGLQNFDDASRLKPVISSTTLSVAPGPSKEQIVDITARIERLVRAHAQGMERLI